jgi:hypothetical protein
MNNESHSHHTSNLPVANPKLRDYVPLMLVIGVILLATLAVCVKVGFAPATLLGYSMGFFFLIFGLFKILDLGMFAMGYREYDIIAKRLPSWGYAYPFVELGLAMAYLAGLNTPWLNLLTTALSLVVVISVALKLQKREVIMCVCLGNVLKVPLTYVSLVEYLAMGLMALAMLVV